MTDEEDADDVDATGECWVGLLGFHQVGPPSRLVRPSTPRLVAPVGCFDRRPFRLRARWSRVDAGDEPDSHLRDGRADNRSDDGGPVLVVLGVVGGVDGCVDVRGGVGERDVGFEAVARMRPAPLAFARRYQGLSGP